MTPGEFRRMALELPEVLESSHMGHPDFRVGGKIFATLGAPDAGWGMVKLPPDEQELFLQIEPEGFQPVRGGWGRQGATNVRLKSAKKSTVREALLAAWRNRAPRSLARHHAGTNAPGTGHSPLGQDRTPKRRRPHPPEGGQRKTVRISSRPGYPAL